MYAGLLDLPWWGYVLTTLGLTHVTIASVTIFLHRHQAHRALSLHPAASHFFRFWLWLTTGMVTREWVAIHRKHHSATETADDPHSPQVRGIRKVLLEGAELYRQEAHNPETVARFGHGTPDDWIERRLYVAHSAAGIALMLLVDLVLFGPIGLTMWAVQMLWIPIFAAGVINGVGHYWGYRNFAPSDASRNILPWGVLIGGEELHNNHHAYASSARFSTKWWEFDVGWFYIRALSLLRLAKVRRVAPRVRFSAAKGACDAETLQAVLTHRYDVLASFARSIRPTVIAEVRKLAADALPELKNTAAVKAAKVWLQRDALALPDRERAVLEEALHSSAVLGTIDSMRKELTAMWERGRSAASTEQLVHQLEEWCRRAEQSGIQALREFSRRLRRYETFAGVPG